MTRAAGALKPGGVLAFTVEAEPRRSTGKISAAQSAAVIRTACDYVRE